MRYSYQQLKQELAQTLAGPLPEREWVFAACQRMTEKFRNGAYDEYLEIAGFSGNGSGMGLVPVLNLIGREALERKAERELGDLERRFQVFPLGVLFHISAGNIPGLGAYSVLEGLLAGNINLLKPSSRDHGVSAFLLRELVREEPRLKPYIYVFLVSSKQQKALRRLISLADGVTVWGSRETVRAVRQLVPPDKQLIEWGHKISFAYVTMAGMEDEEELRLLVTHIRETRQRYCSSCQGIFLDTDDPECVEQLRRKLTELWKHLRDERQEGPGQDLRESSGWNLRESSGWNLQETSNTAHGAAAGADLFHQARETIEVYTIDLEDGLYRQSRIGGCWVAGLSKKQITGGLRKLAGSIQSVGLLCSGEEQADYEYLLFRAGAVRVCPVDELSVPGAADSHDGQLSCARYCKVAARH